MTERMECKACGVWKPLHAFLIISTGFYALDCAQCRNNTAGHTARDVIRTRPQEASYTQPIAIAQSPRTKKCRRCRQYKPLTEYYVQNKAKDKRASECKACFAAAYRQKRPTAIGPVRPVIAGMKYCTRCAEDKPLEDFYAKQHWCKSCQSAAMRARYAQRKQAGLPSPDTLPAEKVCTRCKKSRPLDTFPVQLSNSDGRHSWCRNCNNAYASARHRRARQDAGLDELARLSQEMGYD